MWLRTLRAFAWLRWRTLVNAFERHGARDMVQRLSTAFEQLLPALLVLLMVPSALMLAALSAYAGWLLAVGEGDLTFGLVRFVLLAGTVLALVGPIALPSGDRTNVVRLLLLPIPRGLLYLAQAVSVLADPWTLLVAAVLVALPLGLAAGGAWVAAAVTAAAGLAFLTLLLGLTLVVTSLVQLAVRDRRRGEILTLIFILFVPLIAMVPEVMSDNGRSKRQRQPTSEEQSRQQQQWSAVERVASRYLPSEIYVRTSRTAVHESGGPLLGLLALGAAAGVTHGLAFVAFTRMMTSSAGAAKGTSRTHWAARFPGLSTTTSAIAMAHLKLGLRTPRGRSTILSPMVLFVVFAAMMLRGQSGATFGFVALESGIALASFTSFVALISIVPLAFNQFAIDRAGLILTLLAPVDTRSLLAGKALGGGLMAAIPAGGCVIGSILVFPGGHAGVWLSVPLTLVATYLLVAPAAAALSTIFPKSVDMNSMGRSNAHGAAGLLGMLIFLVAGAPPLLLALGVSRGLERPFLTPFVLLLWIVICAGLSVPLFKAAAALFDRRRENLALLR